MDFESGRALPNPQIIFKLERALGMIQTNLLDGMIIMDSIISELQVSTSQERRLASLINWQEGGVA